MTVGGEVAEALYRDGVSLPCSVGLQPVEFDRVVAGVLAAHKATRGKIAGKPPLS